MYEFVRPGQSPKEKQSVNSKSFLISHGGYSPTPKEPIIPANFKQFNLEAALAGDKVITRDCKTVTQIVKFNTSPYATHSVRAVVNGQIQAYRTDGSFFSSTNPSSNDLFMAQKERTVYLNVYAYGGTIDLFPHNTEAAADEAARANGKTRINVGGKALPVTIFE